MTTTADATTTAHDTDPEATDAVHATAATFTGRWEAWHAEHERALAAPHGFLAVTGLHWLGAAPQRFDGVPGTWRTGAGGAVVVLDPGEALAVDGVPVTGEHAFADIPERGGLRATYGDTVLEVAKRGGRVILRPRHPDHPLRTAFPGTPAFAPDPRWVVQGRYVAFDRPRPTTVGAAVEGLEHVYDALGAVHFTLDGQDLSLTAFGGYDHRLLLLFTDATSGVTTYAANRVLLLDPPGPDAAVTLDFNRATNLPCAYTPFATCPLPPAENRLPVPIEAGEQIPHERP